MTQKENLFQEFEAVSTDKWISTITKTLKDKSIDSLNWSIEEGLITSPIQRAENTISQYIGTATLANNNSWKICEVISIPLSGNYFQANQDILHFLNAGSNALIIDFPIIPNTADLNTLFQGVLLELVDVHFKGSALNLNPLAFLQVIATMNNSEKLCGSCDFGVVLDEVVINCINYCQNTLPNLRLINIPIPSHTSNDLSHAIFVASQWMDKLQLIGKSISQITTLLRFEFYIGDYFFVELANIRAFKKMWFGLLEAYEVADAILPHLHASTLSAQKEDQYWNMITATTQTMAAAIAGVDSIWVCPCNGQQHADDFTRRIARNVAHLLQSESHLNRVIDPAAGSYYIEHLTTAIAQKSWQQFCNL